jgi:hypothetical protein
VWEEGAEAAVPAGVITKGQSSVASDRLRGPEGPLFHGDGDAGEQADRARGQAAPGGQPKAAVPTFLTHYFVATETPGSTASLIQ